MIIVVDCCTVTGTSVPDGLVDPEASDVCTASGLSDTSTPLLLDDVATGVSWDVAAGVSWDVAAVVSWGWFKVSTVGMGSCFRVGVESVVVMVSTAGLSVVAACDCCATEAFVASDAATDELSTVVTTAVDFAGVGVCVVSLVLPVVRVRTVGVPIVLPSLDVLGMGGSPPFGVGVPAVTLFDTEVSD